MSGLTSKTLLISAVLLFTASIVGLTGLQYLMPPFFDNPPAVNHAGITQFSPLMPAPHFVLSVVGFSWIFRLLLSGAWIGYGLILFSAYRGQGMGNSALPVIGAVAVLVAVFFPPSLSSDVYAYAGWGRMWVLHGWNPYVLTLRNLGEIGDPAGLIAPIPATTTHGPVWIAIVCIAVGLLRYAGLWAQVVALKLLAAGALLAAAVSGRAIARSCGSRSADLTMLAIGLNPLFLIEGPGSGHNDILMAALMLGGIALVLAGRSRVGYLVLGLSVGIKFVTAAIVPWLIVRQVSRQPRGTRLAVAAVALGLVLAPVLLAYAAFHVRANAFDGIKTVYEHQTDGVQTTMSTADLVRPAPQSAWTLAAWWRAAVLLLVYSGLSVAVWRFEAPGFYLSCWAAFSVALIVIGAPVPFAWYMIWPLSASLIRWDRLGLQVNLACAALAVVLLAQYSVRFVRS